LPAATAGALAPAQDESFADKTLAPV
jgi:hypothetical protein